MNRGTSEIVPAGDSRWLEWLDQLPHDIYHRPEYHLLSGFGHQGTPYMFSYREQPDRLFLWPYLSRDIFGSRDCDVSSVYGYSGPLATPDADFLSRAWEELVRHWRNQRVVSAFTRFHPLIGNAGLIEANPGSSQGLCSFGTTVSIDLTLPPQAQVLGYQKVLRQEIRKAREIGFVTREDADWSHADSFVRLYRDTMTRRGGRPAYLIDEAWLEECRRALGSRVRLFVAEFQGAIAAALLAIEHGPFLHAHLTGTEAAVAAHSPLKVLLDGIRIWGTERGFRAFHIGGGLGGREDSLFQFKRRFSPVTHPFHIGRWILDPTRYRELESLHRARLADQGYQLANPDFFPAYRCEPVGANTLPQVATGGPLGAEAMKRLTTATRAMREP